MASASTSSLTVSYVGPSSTQTFDHPLPSARITSTKEKTIYLAALRHSVVQLQDDMNSFLTAKMNEDKAVAANVGLKADDKAEEENYGEQTVGEEG